MKEQIYTIPINEAFDRREGCPVCFLGTSLETHSLEYIMGAAMMEPDVRIETNKKGFCRPHYAAMLDMKNRLSLALMLESHFTPLKKLIPSPKRDGPGGTKRAAGDVDKMTRTCFVCERAAEFMKHYYENIIYIWKTEEEFRDKFAGQPFFCLPHYARLLEYAAAGLDKKRAAAFSEQVNGIERAALERSAAYVSAFCKSFDHRFAGTPVDDETKTAIESAIALISGGCGL